MAIVARCNCGTSILECEERCRKCGTPQQVALRMEFQALHIGVQDEALRQKDEAFRQLRKAYQMLRASFDKMSMLASIACAYARRW
jgi:hypothetical protein